MNRMSTENREAGRRKYKKKRALEELLRGGANGTRGRGKLRGKCKDKGGKRLMRERQKGTE